MTLKEFDLEAAGATIDAAITEIDRLRAEVAALRQQVEEKEALVDGLKVNIGLAKEKIAEIRTEWESSLSREMSTFAELKERREEVGELRRHGAKDARDVKSAEQRADAAERQLAEMAAQHARVRDYCESLDNDTLQLRWTAGERAVAQSVLELFTMPPAATGPTREPWQPMTFQAFSEANRLRCVSPEGFGHAIESWSTSDWMTATLGELGEAANIVKKLNRYRDGVRGNTESVASLQTRLAGELADTVIYLDLVFQAIGLDMATAVARTWNAKSKQIGYGVALPTPPASAPTDEEQA